MQPQMSFKPSHNELAMHFGLGDKLAAQGFTHIFLFQFGALSYLIWETPDIF